MKTLSDILEIKVTHANSGQEIFISSNLLFGVYYMSEHKSTVLVAAGGAMIPVKESVEDVMKLTLNQKGETNGEG